MHMLISSGYIVDRDYVRGIPFFTKYYMLTNSGAHAKRGDVETDEVQ